MGFDEESAWKRLALVGDSVIEHQGIRHISLGVCLVVLSAWCGGLLGLSVLAHPLVGFAVCAAGIASYWAAGGWYANRYGEPAGATPVTFGERLPWYIAATMFLFSPLPNSSLALLLFTLVVYIAALALMLWVVSMLARRTLIPHSLTLIALLMAAVMVGRSVYGGQGEAFAASLSLLVMGFGLILMGIRNHRRFVEIFGPGRRSSRG